MVLYIDAFLVPLYQNFFFNLNVIRYELLVNNI